MVEYHNLLERARQTAKEELADERFRKEVEREKARLTTKRWWHRFIPIISITWRKS